MESKSSGKYTDDSKSEQSKHNQNSEMKEENEKYALVDNPNVMN